MPAPTLTPLAPPPTRANPADFSGRADSFLGALPQMVNQLNALITYWNAELDTTAFVNRLSGGTMQGPLVFTSPPTMFASGTTGEQTIMTWGKGTQPRHALRINNDGSLNLTQLNGAVGVFRIAGQLVYHSGNLPTDLVRSSFTLTAGNGLTGLGNLTANRTVTLGTPSSITGSSTNSVGNSTHSHALELGSLSYYTANAWTAPRLIGLDGTDSSTQARISAGAFWNMFGGSRSVNAGAGLVGGGSLDGNVEIRLGIPESITASSGNSRSDTGHTHSLSRDAVLELCSNATVGIRGTYAQLRHDGSIAASPGTTRSGSSLWYATSSGRIDHPGQFSASRPNGTWRLMGVCSSFDNVAENTTSVWLRIA